MKYQLCATDGLHVTTLAIASEPAKLMGWGIDYLKKGIEDGVVEPQKSFSWTMITLSPGKYVMDYEVAFGSRMRLIIMKNEIEILS